MSNNKTIAKNAMFLYFRMFITMGVGLYTSRLVLQTLGVEDYGIYGLVGGIVTMFSFLNYAMSSATQRYLSFDIGKNDLDRLKKTFNATLNIHILIAGIIFLLAETIGLWFINYKLNIPAERMGAANWVYQFSIFTFILGVIQVPYNALLIAREHMNVHAYMSIVEAVLKLIIVLVLVLFGDDKLILYALLTFAVSFIVRMLYKLYCKKHFKESAYEFYYDKSYYKELLSYSGWSLFGSLAAISRIHGSNIILNLFFGPVANAAYTLTSMIQGIVTSFIGNFQTALNPQITKNYANGNLTESISLAFKSAKFSFFALSLMIIPILYNIEYILVLWLKEIPPYVISFIKVALLCTILETISNPLIILIQATGKIKMYQILLGSLMFITLPSIWTVLYFTDNPANVYWVLLVNSLILILFRIYYLRRLLSIDIKKFLVDVIFPISIFSIINLLLYQFLGYKFLGTNILKLILYSILINLINIILIWIIGLNRVEKKFLVEQIKLRLNRK